MTGRNRLSSRPNLRATTSNAPTGWIPAEPARARPAASPTKERQAGGWSPSGRDVRGRASQPTNVTTRASQPTNVTSAR